MAPGVRTGVPPLAKFALPLFHGLIHQDRRVSRHERPTRAARSSIAARNQSRLACAAAFALFTGGLGISAPARADQWDPIPGNNAIDGGSGLWNPAAPNWTNDGGLTNIPWSNGGSAIFSGSTGGTVQLSGGIQAGSLQFDATGNFSTYTLAGLSASDTLTLVGPGTLTTNQNAALTVSLAGSTLLTKLGAARLTLGAPGSSSPAFTGGMLISAGTVELAGDGAAGVGTIQISAGGTLVNNSSTIANAVNLTGGSLALAGNDATFSGLIGVGSSSVIASTISGKTLTLSGQIAGTAGLTFDVANGGNIAITSASNFDAPSSSNSFNVRCTNTLPYTLALDTAAVTDSVLALDYTLALSAATGSAGLNSAAVARRSA